MFYDGAIYKQRREKQQIPSFRITRCSYRYKNIHIFPTFGNYISSHRVVFVKQRDTRQLSTCVTNNLQE